MSAVTVNLFYFEPEKWNRADIKSVSNVGWISFGVEIFILIYLLLQAVQELREFIFTERDSNTDCNSSADRDINSTDHHSESGTIWNRNSGPVADSTTTKHSHV